jgi:hypothetical protein
MKIERRQNGGIRYGVVIIPRREIRFHVGKRNYCLVYCNFRSKNPE